MSKPQTPFGRSGRYYTKEELSRKERHECMQCGKPTKRYAWKGWGGEKFKTFCSEECSKAWWLSHDWTNMRVAFLKKHENNLVCNKCGKKIEIDMKQYSVFGIQTWGILQVDHIIPICLGGMEFDESNLQILCMDCAKKKNSKDAEKLVNFRNGLFAISCLRYLFNYERYCLEDFIMSQS